MAGWRARCRTRPAPPGGSPPVSRARGRAWPAQPGGSRPTDRGARCGGWTGRACRGPASRPGSAAGRAWDQGGNRARVLRLYWRGEEFAPVFEPAAERVTRLPERAPLGEGPPPVAAWWQALRDFRLVQAEIDGLLAGLDDPAVRAGIGEQARQLTDLGENFAATEPGPTDQATPLLQLPPDRCTQRGGPRCAAARFRVTDAREAAGGSAAVVSLTELRLAPAVMAAAPVPGLFVVGLDLDQRAEPRDVLYDRGGNHAVIGPSDDLADALGRLGWRGETVVIVTEREPDDAIGHMADEFDELRADVFVPRVGATVVSADGVPETRDAAGAAADLWDRYESSSLRDAVGVPAWFVQERAQIRPAPGPSLITFSDGRGFASMGAAAFLDHGDLLVSQVEPRLFDLWLPRDGHELGLADLQGRFLAFSAELMSLMPDPPPDADEIRLIVDDGEEVMAAAAALA